MAAQYSFVPAPPETLPKDGWQFAAQTLTLLKSAYHDKHASTERFNERLDLAEQYRIFDRLPTPDQPYGSLDAMLQAEIGASKDEAIENKIRRIAEAAKPQLTLAETMIGNQNATKKPNSLMNHQAVSKPTQAERFTARIARDRPDILEDMKAGKYRSVRAAAIDAGIVKVPTSLEVAKKVFLKLSKDERETFLIWVSEL